LNNNNGITPTDLLSINRMIEQYGLTAILSAIGASCHDKAKHMLDHIEDSHHEALAWSKAGDLIDVMMTDYIGWPS
jgi:hypothetical protein